MSEEPIIVPLDDPNVPESLVPIPNRTSCNYLELVREFHAKYHHYMGNMNVVPPANIIELREKLISEEAQEFSGAIFDFQVTDDYSKQIVLIADSLADLLYVTFGAALAYGIPIEEVFREVHRSNMTKSMEKDTKSIPGKTIKGPNYDPPKIAEILERHMK